MKSLTVSLDLCRTALKRQINVIVTIVYCTTDYVVGDVIILRHYRYFSSSHRDGRDQPFIARAVHTTLSLRLLHTAESAPLHLDTSNRVVPVDRMQ